ncbi:unnamed protein product [Blumeria hordei]|uniref:Mediator of RNA polymerase II transcription subunit 11 n=1 Tax=Blumeria hordei TaxID=2867405 RepID=A0A383UNW4_BLUHO|nr:unnamed protein product [Blumeria hordei]
MIFRKLSIPSLINMSSHLNENSDSSQFVPFTKSERIQQLNDIDKSMNQLLKSAGLAIQTLSVKQPSLSLTTSERRQKFEENCNTYLCTLQIIDIGLHRQIYGLEQAGIIPADKTKKERSSTEAFMTASVANRSMERDSLQVEGGMGKFDIGLLNSQSGRILRDLEAELWEKARCLLEDLYQNSDSPGALEDVDMIK